MSSKDDKRFIETLTSPIDAVNEVSAKEKQGGDLPPYWWIRKPLTDARALIAEHCY